MWSRFLQRIRAFLLPFQTIATELGILRQLYELELSARTPPIIRVTESPKKDDTLVMYGDGSDLTDKERKRMELEAIWADEPE